MSSVLRKMAVTLGLTIMAGAASAATVSYTEDASEVLVTEHGFGSSETYGTDIVGMVVSVNYADGTSEDLTWAAVRPGYSLDGFVASSGMSMIFGAFDFELTATKLMTSISFDFGSAGAVVDILRNYEGFDTPGTGRGFRFFLADGDTNVGDVHVIYSKAVVLKGVEPGKDLYSIMTLDFAGLEGGGLSGFMAFKTDLDSLAVADLTPLVPNPLPAGMPLMAGGLLAFAGLRRRRKS